MKMVEKPASCAVCGVALAQPASGRPRVYCGVPCRRYAEAELRAAQALLRRAMQREQDAGAALAEGVSWDRPVLQRRLDYWRDEAARCRAALRDLFDGNGDSEEEEER